ANPAAKSANGVTALDIANTRRHADTSKLIQSFLTEKVLVSRNFNDTNSDGDIYDSQSHEIRLLIAVKKNCPCPLKLSH
ncbi:MAG: hypothetical protein K0U34_02380, partial [Alphaproteobacteria bacterium]|nr:hypothetical protein [Alphaproteobacteria bacterium]